MKKNKVIQIIHEEIEQALSKKLYIMRGVSGSGKSTLAKKLVNNDMSKVFSADDYFMGEDGNYNFDPSKLGAAHAWNQKRAQQAMEQGITPIAIDNTHTQKWEARPYVEMGQKYGYDIEFKESEAPWKNDAEELAKRNIHKTPRSAIERMLQRYEPNKDFTIDQILKSKSPWEK